MAVTNPSRGTASPGLFLGLLMAGLLLAWAPKEEMGKVPHHSETPKLALTVSPAFGFTPLAVQLVATLSGVGPRDANYCHAGVTWVRIDPGSSPETGAKMSE